MLAALVLRAGEVVPLDRLIDDLWGERAPATAPHAVRVYVSQLRKALGDGAAALETRGRAYVLHVGPDELDLTRFERLHAAGRAALEARQPAIAEERLGAALALWRGPPLADLAYEAFAQAAVARLDELRALALEDHVDAELALGRHEQLVARLEGLVREHGHRERLHGQLMLALYRCGRQADALDAYRRVPRPARRRAGHRADAPPAGPAGGDPAARSGTRVRPAARRAGRGRRRRRADGRRRLPGRGAARRGGGGRRGARGRASRRPRRCSCGPSAPTPTWRRSSDRSTRGGLPRSPVAYPHAPPPSAPPTAARTASASPRSWRPTLLLVDAPAALVDDGELGPDARAVLATAACDVALVATAAALRVDPHGSLLVPFGGSEHDWAALELAARLASSRGAALRLLGVVDEAEGEDASRVLAGASLVLQRIVGIAAEPVLASRDPEALAAAAADAALLVVGLSTRWQADGLGAARLALVQQAGRPTLLVRRGIRPGLFAPRESATRFTWASGPGRAS